MRLHHLVNPLPLALFFAQSSHGAGTRSAARPRGAGAGRQAQDAAAGGCSEGLAGSRQGVEPGMSLFAPKEPFTVKK